MGMIRGGNSPLASTVSTLLSVAFTLLQPLLTKDGKWLPPIPAFSGTTGNGKSTDVTRLFLIFPVFPVKLVVGVYERTIAPVSNAYQYASRTRRPLLLETREIREIWVFRRAVLDFNWKKSTGNGGYSSRVPVANHADIRFSWVVRDSE